MTTETVFRRLKKYCRAQIAWSEKQLANPFEDLGKRGRREHGAGWKGEHRGTIATAQELIDEIHLLRQEHRKRSRG